MNNNSINNNTSRCYIITKKRDGEIAANAYVRTRKSEWMNK